MASLDDSVLADLPSAVSVPDYRRDDLIAGIAHIGAGAFHRAHQALAIDDLLNAGLAKDWAICAISLTGGTAAPAAAAAQDGLYTLIEKHPDGHHDVKVVGSIIDYVSLNDGAEGVITRLTDPAIRIVSLTVTEGGYGINHTTGEFDLSAPAVAADLAEGAEPATVFGIVTEALRRRRDDHVKPFTVLSCDNLQHNGKVAKKAFVAFASAKNRELGAWIDSYVRFPETMVDRITPVTTDADRAEAARALTGTGATIEDAWPVVAEPFFQWVIEDDFGNGRPPFEKSPVPARPVQLVEDVAPYELMKLRLLNISHQAMAYFSALLGYELVHDAAADPLIAGFLARYMAEEGRPTLLPVPGIDLDEYTATLVERFANPEVRDTIARLAAETSTRIPQWLTPVIAAQLAAGRSVTMSAAIVASWARYDEGVDEHGAPIDVVDPQRERLMSSAQDYPRDPLAFLRHEDLFGDLANTPAFADEYRRILDSLHTVGARATLQGLLSA